MTIPEIVELLKSAKTCDGKTGELRQCELHDVPNNIEYLDVTGRWRTLLSPLKHVIIYETTKFRINEDLEELIPYTAKDSSYFRAREFKQKIGNTNNRRYAVLAYDDYFVWTVEGSITYSQFLENYIYVEGTPCGKKVKK